MILPLLYVTVSVLGFMYGVMYDTYHADTLTAPLYKIGGLHIGLLSLFIVTSELLSPFTLPYFFNELLYDLSMQSPFIQLFIGCMVTGALLAFITLQKHSFCLSQVSVIESCVALAVIITSFFCFFILQIPSLSALVYKAIFILLLISMIAHAVFTKQKAALIGALGWTCICVQAQYIRYSWSYLPVYTFVAGELLFSIGVWILIRMVRNKNLFLVPMLQRIYPLKKILVCIGLVWIACLTGVYIYKEYLLRYSQTIRLKVHKVHFPYLFNQYGKIVFDISSVDLTTIHGHKKKWQMGDTLYVILQKKDRYCALKGVTTQQPKQSLSLKGTVSSVEGTTLYINYGIETFFIPGLSKALLKKVHDKMSEARVAVTRSGTALIQR